MLTQDQVNEIRKCADDPIYFIETYVKIDELEPFKLYPSQKASILDYHNRRSAMTSDKRRTGVTFGLVAYLCYWVVFNFEKTGIVLSHKEAHAKDILAQVTVAYDNLPEFFKKKMTRRQKTTIEFEDSTVLLAKHCSRDAARGRAFNMIMIDNFDYISKDVAKEFMDCILPIHQASKFSKFITASTR